MEHKHTQNSLFAPIAPIPGVSWVEAWLSSLGLRDKYFKWFIEAGYDNSLACKELEERDLDAIGITLPGHRKTLLLASKSIRTDTRTHAVTLSAAEGISNDKSVTCSNGAKKMPILSNIDKTSLAGLNYFTRAKERAGPIDDHLPVLDGDSPKLRIILVRHGESQANVDLTMYSRVADHAVPLSARGEQQAIAAGEKIANYLRSAVNPSAGDGAKPPEGHYCRLWTSPYLRARQTAELIRTHSGGWVSDVRENMLLVEQQFGLFEGVDWYTGELDDQFPMELQHYRKAAEFGGRFWAQVPLGESRFQVCQRVYQSFGTFHRDARRHGITNLVIVAHGVTLRAFMTMWLHLTPEWFEEEPNPPNCSIRVIDNCVDLGYIWPTKETATRTMDSADLLMASVSASGSGSSGATGGSAAK